MSQKNKIKPQITEFLFPILSRTASDQTSNKMTLTSKLVLLFLMLSAVFVGSILLRQQDNSYRSQLMNSLGSLTSTEQGTVTVLASQTGLDASMATSFRASKKAPQKTQTRLNYLQSSELDRNIELLDVFTDPYAELPLSDDRVWVSVKTKDDIKALESLGFPVGTLISENAHTPLLPFGNFKSEDSKKINTALKVAVKDADFIRADEGLLEYQTEITEDEAMAIVDSTSASSEPMSRQAASQLFQNGQPVLLSLKLERSSGRLVAAELNTSINNEPVQATYEFDYSAIDLPQEPPMSISASKFVDRYLKAVSND